MIFNNQTKKYLHEYSFCVKERIKRALIFDLKSVEQKKLFNQKFFCILLLFSLNIQIVIRNKKINKLIQLGSSKQYKPDVNIILASLGKEMVNQIIIFIKIYQIKCSFKLKQIQLVIKIALINFILKNKKQTMIKDLISSKSFFTLAILLSLASSQQFNEDLLLSKEYPMSSTRIDNINYLVQFEFWSFCMTTFTPISYPQVEQKLQYDQAKSQLLFLIKSEQKVLMFMYANVMTENYVIHNFIVNNQNYQIYYDPQNYEGVWIMNLVTFYDYKYLIFETMDGINTNQLWIDFRYPKSVEFIVGGTGIINRIYELGIFRGRLSNLWYQYNYRYPNDIYGTIQWLRMKEYQQTFNLIPDVFNFDGKIQKEFEFEQFGRKFSLFGWVKYYSHDAYSLKQYLIVRLTTFKNYQDEINLGDEIVKIIMNIDLSNQNNCGYDVISHHYRMPYPTFIENSRHDKLTIRQDLPYQTLLTKWHFISFEYGLEQKESKSQFKVNFFEDKILQSHTYPLGDSHYHSLFINTKYYFIFGGDYFLFDKLKGQLAGFQFVSNYNENLNKEYSCHSSCKTCFGPLQNNCLSCYENPQNIYLEEQNQCSCPIDHIYKDNQCVFYQDQFKTIIYKEFMQDFGNSECPFGYFNLPDPGICIECPQLNSYNVFCLDCFLNSQTWHKQPVCKKDLITQQVSQKEDAYTLSIRSTKDYDFYYIEKKETIQTLVFLEGVQDYCDIKDILLQNCFQLEVKHQNQDTFGFCKQNYYYSDLKCIELHKACVKVNQINQLCVECLSGYYLSEDKKSCIQCSNFCQICLEQDYCVSCESGFGLVNGQCQKCGNFCKVCQFSLVFQILRCLSCLDNYKYYLSLNAEHCRINQIENCLIAFEKSQTTYSLDYEFQPTQESATILCAKCKDGYYLNEETSSCLQGELQDCHQFYKQTVISFQFKVCLYGLYDSKKVIFSFSDECPKINLNCRQCVIEQLSYYYDELQMMLKKVSYSCILCQNGYYAQKLTGSCVQCPPQLNCLSCFEQNKYSKDDWKNEIRAFYKYFIVRDRIEHKFIEYGISQNELDYEILCHSCQEGYELHENQCIEICPPSCLQCKLQNNKNICVKCPQGIQLRSRSLIDNQCITCPNLCESCYKREQTDVLSINPLFNNSEFSNYSYQCLFSEKGTFDQELGIFIDCKSQKCKRSIYINLDLICDSDQYNQQLNSFENEEERKQYKQKTILSDHLFSSSSFSEFETKEFYQLANEKTIKQIIIIIVSYRIQKCTVIDQLQISQKFSQNIFSAIDVQLYFYGNGITSIQFKKQLTFLNFKKVHVQGFNIEIEFFEFGLSLLMFKSAFDQTIELMDINYEQQQKQITFYIIMQNAINVHISNFQLKYVTRQYFLEYFIKIDQISKKQTVKVENLNIYKSVFWNTNFFLFYFKENDLVEMKNITIEISQFNLPFISQTLGSLYIDQMYMIQTELYYSKGFFSIYQLNYFELKNLELFGCYLFNSKLFNLNKHAKMEYLTFTENNLEEGSCFFINEEIEMYYIELQNTVFALNTYSEKDRFIKTSQLIKPNEELHLINLKIIGNKLQQKSLESFFDILDITLVFLSANFIKIENLIIQKNNGFPDMVIADSNEVTLNIINISQHVEYGFKGIFEQFDCFKQAIINEYYYLSISIQNVPKIKITQLVIQKAQSINYPLIEIKNSIVRTKKKHIIEFSELEFTSNLILITNKIKKASIVLIQSQVDYQIDIINSRFEKNIMHHYNQLDLINTGLLFNIDCSYCTILISNLIIQNNIVTNSSNSILYIQTQNLIIENSIFTQNNLFDYSILQPYLYWGFQDNQEIFVEQILKILPIIVLTGTGKIICQEIIIRNVTISNSTGSGLYIYLEKEASVNIQDTIISNISTQFHGNDEDGGSFLFDTSIASSVYIQLQNVIAKDVYCKNRGGLIYIQNGQGKTIIKLQDLILNDVYSLRGSIIQVEFSEYKQQEQEIMVNHLDFQNSIQGYLKFIEKFSITNTQLLTQLQLQRSLIEIACANFISLRNIVIILLNYESFITISQTQKVEIFNTKITNSTFINSMITFNLNKKDSQINIINFSIKNVKVKDQIDLLDKCIFSSSQLIQYQQICSTNKFLEESPIFLQYYKIETNLSNAYCVIEQINKLQKQPISSLLNINPSQTQVQISQFHLTNINCKICQKGLLNMEIYDNESLIIINQIFIYDNYCGQQSCLNIFKSVLNSRLLQSFNSYINSKQFDLKIRKYNCMRNFAQKGTCLFIQDVTTLIEDSIFLNNTAEEQGGSLYINGQQYFFIMNSLIQNNKASQGGGVFFKDQINQNLINQQTLIHENVATQYGQNFAQKPSQLSVSIDLKHLLSKIKIVEKDNLLVEQVQVEKYSLFFKNYSNALYVPNGQSLYKYQYFDLKNKEYISYNFHLRVIPLDNFNNVQENLDNTICTIGARLLKQNEESDYLENFTNFNQAYFNKSYYNFDDIIFYLDNQLNMTLQIQFHCNSIFTPIYGKQGEIMGYHNNYYLRMNINSLPCQLGEIKSVNDNTCVPCNATQGLYSLILNSNSCSQKDDVTTSDIKSAQLKLKPGFWRPYFDTDDVSQCINLLVNCNGGWNEGDTSCYLGHIGALCEECDLHNIRGLGHFSTSNKYSCGSCIDKSKNAVVIAGISLWTLISILITVRSNKSLNEQMLLKRIISRLIPSRVQYHSNFGILIKMITNHLQIVSAVFTFRFTSLIGVGNLVNAVSNPIQTMTHSLDCFLKDIFPFEIHYSVIFWQIIMPFIYIVLFFSLYSIDLLIFKREFSLNIITTTLIYMYIYVQPFLVGGLISLISFRHISGFLWISANVSFRYDTNTHYNWLLNFCIPVLLFISILIPLYFFMSLYSNKTTLSQKITRNKWGYLYNEYNLDAYYWELIKITVKQLLIIFLSFYDDNVVKKGILLLSVVYIYYEISQKYKPFRSHILNKLDAYSANVCAISMAVGIGIYIDQQSQSYEIQIPYLIILLAFNLQYLVKIFKEIVASFIEENAYFFDKIKEIILNHLPWIQRYQIFKKILQNRNVQKQRIQIRYLKIKKYLIAKAQYIIKCKNNYGVKISNSTNFKSLD
ncbi:unnamed protein product [Paramecium sonneborni]|uniref:EGF-like domain-containing protein n=1 Tax=Paramecium sonneborni TaxID=65129 RepID=A0A8S1Q1N6_9CILI|nr:unnamed protein product [Paramecium sonneborni]